MPFGKHNGKTIQTLIDEGESQYLLWAHDDEQYVPWFELGHILYDEVADKL